MAEAELLAPHFVAYFSPSPYDMRLKSSPPQRPFTVWLAPVRLLLTVVHVLEPLTRRRNQYLSTPEVCVHVNVTLVEPDVAVNPDGGGGFGSVQAGRVAETELLEPHCSAYVFPSPYDLRRKSCPPQRPLTVRTVPVRLLLTVVHVLEPLLRRSNQYLETPELCDHLNVTLVEPDVALNPDGLGGDGNGVDVGVGVGVFTLMLTLANS